MTSTSPATRYLLDTDDDGHWYLIPVGRQDAFAAYVASEGMADFPDGVLSLGYHPNTVKLEKPHK